MIKYIWFQLPVLWEIITLLNICHCQWGWENSRPTIIIMSRVKVWKCPPREAAVILSLSGWLLLCCPQNIAKYKRTKSWGLSVTKYLECFSEIQLEGMSSGSGEVLSSLRGKIIELPESKEKEEWTPFNGEMHMQGIKVSIISEYSDYNGL